MLRWALILILIVACGCTGPEFRIHESRDSARAIKTLSGPASGEQLSWHGTGRLSLELKRLNAFSAELTDIAREMTALNRTVAGKKIEFYSINEHERIESMLFRYLVCREALWDVASYYGKRQSLFTSPTDKIKSFIIAYSAALKVQYTDTKMIVTFIDDPVIVSKLNEGYAPCRIPAGSFDRIFHATTSVDHLEAMEASWQLFKEEADNPKSKLSRVARADRVYGDMVRDIKVQRLYAKAQTDRLLDKTSVLFPNMSNRIKQSKVTALAATTKDTFKSSLGACGSLMGSLTTQLIKAPLATTVHWGLGDLQKMFAAAQPGDIILTVREGYLSNIIIPGAFKHGLTYVGAVSERRLAGLSKRALVNVPAPVRQRASTYLFRAKDSTGATANCIEAVAEGVVMSSTHRLTRLAMSKILILRPTLTPPERLNQLAKVFSHLEEPYDFKFNFVDDRRLCCTESIYRSLNGRGNLAFRLVKRMGIMTLSADDIIRTYFDRLDHGTPMLEFVALAEEVPGSAKHAGRVLTGRAGIERLRAIMNIPAPRADGAPLSQRPAPPTPLADNDPIHLRLADPRHSVFQLARATPLSTARFVTETTNRRTPCSIPSLHSF